MNSAAKSIALLDRVRAVAILCVLAFHTGSFVFGTEGLPWHGLWRDFSVPAGRLAFLPCELAGPAGVAVFFIVSGFCIHLSFQRSDGRWGAFFLRRGFRIFPAYLAAMAFILAINHVHEPMADANWWSGDTPLQVVTHVLLVHNFNPQTYFGITGAMWSLAIEAQLYLLYPVLLWLAGKTGWPRALLILALVEGCLRAFHGGTEAWGEVGSFGNRLAWQLAESPLGYWFSWATGAALAEAWHKGRPLPFLRPPVWLWLSLAVGCHFFRPLADFQFPCFALLTAGVTGRLLVSTGGRTAPVLLTDCLGWIGRVSYSLYLIHQPLLNLCSLALAMKLPSVAVAPGWSFLVLTASWTLLVGFSYYWWRCLELPGIALGKRCAGESRRPASPDPRPPQAVIAGIAAPVWIRLAVLLGIVGFCLWVSAQLAPPDPRMENNLAWRLATDPDANRRNGPLAVQIAQDACKQTHYQITIFLGTLAAAYAEAGRYNDAVTTAENACQLAARNGEADLLARNRALLALYQQHQPYHSPPPPPDSMLTP